ncbi:hypothetical protein BSU04_46655 [Caballeronia sordidicola]|uniref:Uncharacterized protein n=1 Tax=Caballeronia sordidicola TaxID=196367 RepID=A0A226WL05_CABSO|nr:hypothetical protein BSU04_46655 [Caballeronia sordidicola]
MKGQMGFVSTGWQQSRGTCRLTCAGSVMLANRANSRQA